MNNEEIKNEFVNCIEGTNTLNLATSVLEDREEYKKEIERLTENNQAYQEELCKVWKERDNAYRIINELEEELNKDFTTYLQKATTMREIGKTYKAGADNYRMHIYLKLQELKGSDRNE